MRKIRNKRRNKRFCKGIVSLLVAALLLNQSSLLMHAEESREEAGVDVVTEEVAGNPDADEDVNTDTDSDAISDITVDEETAGSDTGEETEEPNRDEGENADGDTDAVSDMYKGDEGIVLLQDDEAENVVEEDAVSPAADWKTFQDDTFTYAIVSEEENNLQVAITGYVDERLASGSLEIPAAVLHETRKYTVMSVGYQAFNNCLNLTSVTIPASVTQIGMQAFSDCKSLTTVTMLNDKILVGNEAFLNCEALSSLKIAVPEEIIETSNLANVFFGCPKPGERFLTFLTQDGTKELDGTTKPTLAYAVSVYKAVYDGDGDSETWYGWTLPDVPGYPVTINVSKDGDAWENSGRTFALSSGNGNPLITDLANVSDGTYTIYDITDHANHVDTKVSVTVNGAAAQAVVNYHTVTFYNGATEFRKDFVPNNTTVNRPSDAPEKDGYTFKQWVTSENGSTAFDFTAPIMGATDIYADWSLKNEDIFYITVVVNPERGGSVDPIGPVPVKSGENSPPFTIKPNANYWISSILVGGKEQLNGIQTTDDSRVEITDEEGGIKRCVFENVTDNYTLEVLFATDQTSTGDDSSSGSTGSGDGNDSGSGSTGGGGNGSSGSGGNSSDNGSGSPGSGGTDGNSGSGDFGGGDGNSSNGGSGNNSSAITSDISAASDAGIVQTGGAAPVSGGKEPKTGDAFHVEVYAALAMIVGLFYLLLYFADGVGGMTEEEKRELIARLVRWAEKGKPFRKYAALAAIFMVLVYYHAVGKRTTADWKAVYER